MKYKKLLYACSILLFGWIVSCKIVEPTPPELQLLIPNDITEHMLNPETKYTFGIKSGLYDSVIFSADLIRKDGSFFNIIRSSAGSVTVQYKPDTIPEGEWMRGGANNTYVKGLLSCITYNENIPDTAYYDFFVPLKPDKPQIALLDTQVNSKDMTAFIWFSSEGAVEYKIDYTVFGEVSDKTITIDNEKKAICILANLHPAKRYSIFVQAVNSFGISVSDTITIGSNNKTASCILEKNNNELQYKIKVGEVIMEDVVIVSAGIYDFNGILQMEVPKVQNQYFSIASLPAGIYVLKVEVKDYGFCGKIFIK